MITSVHEILHIGQALGLGPLLPSLSILVFDSCDLCLVKVYKLITIAQLDGMSGLTWLDLMMTMGRRRSVRQDPTPCDGNQGLVRHIT